MRILREWAVLAVAGVLLTGCSGGEDPSTSEVWETCRDHVQAEAGEMNSTVTDFDASSVNVSEQGGGWRVDGTASPPDGPVVQFYCEVDRDRSVTDSQITFDSLNG